MDQIFLLDMPNYLSGHWATASAGLSGNTMVSTDSVKQLTSLSDSNKENWKKALCAFLVLDSLGTNNKMEATFLASTPPSSVRYWAVNLQNAMEVSRKP